MVLVEHSFVTTRDAPDVLSTTMTWLVTAGFRCEEASDSHVQAVRGKVNPGAARSIAELPQRVRVQFDRGRVTIATWIQPQKQAGPLHKALLTALAQTLELLLASTPDTERARSLWQTVESSIAHDAGRRRRNHRIALLCLVGFLILVVTGIVLSISAMSTHYRG